MNPVARLVGTLSGKARARRRAVFRDAFQLGADTRILDLGSETGSNIQSVLQGSAVKAGNVYIADIDATALERGKAKFGFVPVLIDESGKLPFPDGFFDIVYCSSVIEHVTVPKEQVWSLTSGRDFRNQAWVHQQRFANEIQRLGRQYFVQTPNRHFLVESHSWLPIVAWLPRRLLIRVLRITNSFWVKRTSPDWHLLDRKQMAALFAGADIVAEKWLWMTKSIMAIKK